jgi:uncharacterized lipoprotein NlpE involved in copper resistance
MRLSLPILVLSILSACSNAPTEEQGATLPVEPAAQGLVEWTGYYDGIFPRGKDRATMVQLWVRSDSIFIIRQRLVDADTLAEGALGTWRVVHISGGPVSGLLSIQYGGDPPDHYQRTDKGLVFVDVIGGVEVAQDWTLERLADEAQDEIPRMKVSGTFTYMADAKSFQPCGSQFTWPCAGGLDMRAEEGELVGSMNGADLERAYLKAVGQGGKPWTIEVECSLDQGPAMEGDGMEEYLLIHRVLGPIEECP